MSATNGVSSSDGPASIGMSSIFSVPAGIARRLLIVGVRCVVELAPLVDVLVGLLVFRER